MTKLKDGERGSRKGTSCGDHPRRQRSPRGRDSFSSSPVWKELPDVTDIAQSMAGVFFETLSQQALQSRRRVAEIWLILDHRREHLRQVLAPEETLADEHLVEHDTERPDVGPVVDRLALGLLGTHVRRRAQDHARGGAMDAQRRRARCGGRPVGVLLQHLRQSKVEDFHLAVRRHLDVGRLEVAMDDAFFVRRFEGICDLARHEQRLVDRDRATRRQIGQRLALDQFEDDGRDGADLLEAVHGRDIRMVESGKQFGFALKAGEPFAVTGERLRQHFEGDITFQARVSGTIDFAHSACAKGRLDDKRAESCACG